MFAQQVSKCIDFFLNLYLEVLQVSNFCCRLGQTTFIKQVLLDSIITEVIISMTVDDEVLVAISIFSILFNMNEFIEMIKPSNALDCLHAH